MSDFGLWIRQRVDQDAAHDAKNGSLMASASVSSTAPVKVGFRRSPGAAWRR